MSTDHGVKDAAAANIDDTYERGIERLIACVENQNTTDRKKISFAGLSAELNDAAQRIDTLAAWLNDGGAAQAFLQEQHEERSRLTPRADRPPNYLTVRWGLLALADSARAAADSLPDARKQNALPTAALGMLYLRHRHRIALSSKPLSDTSREVKELCRICRKAGMWLTAETVRGALSKALREFDPQWPPPPPLDSVLR